MEQLSLLDEHSGKRQHEGRSVIFFCAHHSPLPVVMTSEGEASGDSQPVFPLEQSSACGEQDIVGLRRARYCRPAPGRPACGGLLHVEPVAGQAVVHPIAGVHNVRPWWVSSHVGLKQSAH